MWFVFAYDFVATEKKRIQRLLLTFIFMKLLI